MKPKLPPWLASFFIFATVTLLGGATPANASSRPVIIAQPTGGVLTAGQSFALSVTNTGSAPLVYKWIKDGVLLPN